MDSDRDTFLNIFSRRIVAATRPGQRWEITIDGEPHPHSGEDCSPATTRQTLKGLDDAHAEHFQQLEQLQEQRYRADSAGSIIVKSPGLASAYPPLSESSSSSTMLLAPVLEFASAAAGATSRRSTL